MGERRGGEVLHGTVSTSTHSTATWPRLDLFTELLLAIGANGRVIGGFTTTPACTFRSVWASLHALGIVAAFYMRV